MKLLVRSERELVLGGAAYAHFAGRNSRVVAHGKSRARLAVLGLLGCELGGTN